MLEYLGSKDNWRAKSDTLHLNGEECKGMITHNQVQVETVIRSRYGPYFSSTFISFPVLLQAHHRYYTYVLGVNGCEYFYTKKGKVSEIEGRGYKFEPYLIS